MLESQLGALEKKLHSFLAEHNVTTQEEEEEGRTGDKEASGVEKKSTSQGIPKETNSSEPSAKEE